MIPDQPGMPIWRPFATRAHGPVPDADELLAAFDDTYRIAVPAGEHFGHRQRLHVAWLLMRRLGLEVGAEATMLGIRLHNAQDTGDEIDREPVTLTGFWTRLIAHVQQIRPDLEDFESAIRAFPLLLDPALFRRQVRRKTPPKPGFTTRWGDPDPIAVR